MKNRKNNDLRKRIAYQIDLWMSNSTSSMIMLLFFVTGMLILILGFFTWMASGGELSLGSSFWGIFMHTLDPGVVSGDDGPAIFLFIMVLATFAGVFFLALLIGFINDGIQSRIEDFSQGIEPVIEKDHTIILGFNDATFVLIQQLILADENQGKRRNVVVVMDEYEKKEMENKISMRFPDTGNLNIICRSGSISSYNDLHRCSILTCKSIIVAEENDFQSVKAILACTQILNQPSVQSKAFITAAINKSENERVAKIAGHDVSEPRHGQDAQDDRLELIMLENQVARIIAHTCSQTGLSKVFVELFDYEGSELYILKPEELEDNLPYMKNKTLREINHHLEEAVAVGVIDENGEVVIDDPNKVVFRDGNELILLEVDDDKVKYKHNTEIQETTPAAQYEGQPISILVLGSNTKLQFILSEMQYYLSPGSRLYVAAGTSGEGTSDLGDIAEALSDKDISLSWDRESDIFNYDLLGGIIEKANPDYIMILSPDTEDDDLNDELSLKVLLFVQEFRRRHPQKPFGLTCEMCRMENQELVKKLEASDFIISKNIAALMMAQISETRQLLKVFDSLLQNEGFEVYIKPAKYYLTPGKEYDFYTITDAVAEKKEIFLGYLEENNGQNDAVVNPAKTVNGVDTKRFINDEDKLIVLAEDKLIR